MAYTITPRMTGPTMVAMTVVASDDADGDVDVPHGLGATPLFLALSPLYNPPSDGVLAAVCLRALPNATNVLCSKNAGLSTAGTGFYLVAALPHTIVR